MSVRKAAGASVAALVAATLALTAGCGAGGDEPAKSKERDKSGRPTASSPATPGEEPPPREDGRERKPKGPKREATPVVPRASLTPATGSFTKKEKKYLVGRVPEGLEPAAVLEAGRTACARLRTTAKASRKDAISALKAGEIDNAEPAIEHLCPKFEPLLKAAGKK
ncbi:hypothetical protein [Streptomyces sp. 891-h]|uniref:hypothetical protein n=1 Tax=Streptomyces sp. 891-h TaxID=2720714 RepID=UPI001FA99C88|nr:hypothetical protein [Streptomyces sp. 891-h]UNZ19580.1 hypothetical protein HC362_23645 [Streptomyces sp. 891-h]